MRNLEESLRRLRTDYIDVYWLHAWDFLTPVEEIMRALDDMVRAGKVLCLGISDTPAWIVAYANAIARQSRNEVTERGLAVADVVVSVAAEIGCTPAQVALAWLLHQPGSVIPLIGARHVEQLDDNLGCLDVEPTAEQLERLDKTGDVDLGFPHDFIASPAILDQVHGNAYPRLAAHPRWGR